jgi:hypothetical protein
MTFEELGSKVLDWADSRGILDNSSDTAQLLKAFSEMGELADAHNKNDEAGIIDGIGDVLVCLINYCAIAGLDMLTCLGMAYDEIKDRKGYLNANGVFVKES